MRKAGKRRQNRESYDTGQVAREGDFRGVSVWRRRKKRDRHPNYLAKRERNEEKKTFPCLGGRERERTRK